MFKIGDIVEALENSNAEYNITSKKSNFVGEVIDFRNHFFFSPQEIKVRIIENVKIEEIGEEYWVEPRYFTICKNNRITINKLRGVASSQGL